MNDSQIPKSESSNTECQRCASLLIERHRRIEAEQTILSLTEERNRYADASRRALERLDEVSNLLPTLDSLLDAYEMAKGVASSSSHIIEELSELAFAFASTLQQKAAVLRLCTRADHLPGKVLPVRSISGLPRLRVFSDEACSVRLCVLDSDREILWSSQLVNVEQSSIDNAFWGTPVNVETPVVIPLGLFNSSSESKIGIMFESSIVAETRFLSEQELRASHQFPLFHDEVPMDSAFLSFGGEDVEDDPAEYMLCALTFRVISVQGVEFDMEPDMDTSSPLVLIKSLVSGHQAVISMDDISDDELSASLDLEVSPRAESVEVRVELAVGSVTVASAPVSLSISRDDKTSRIVSVPLFSPGGSRNGLLALEYEVGTIDESRVGATAYRCG